MKWYAFFVKTGKEDTVCKYLNQILSYHTNFNLLVPKRGLIEYNSGIKTLVYKPLFPGYILIHTESMLRHLQMIFSVKWQNFV